MGSELSESGERLLKHFQSKNHVNQFENEVLSDGDYLNYLLQIGSITPDDAYIIADRLN